MSMTLRGFNHINIGCRQRDLAGNKLEFNFPNAEAPQTVALGTLAPMQFPA